MRTHGTRTNVGKVYLTAVPWIGTAVLLWALVDLVLHPPDSSWWALAALTILTGSFTVKIPGLVARLSVSEPFVFAATLWFGPSVGAVTAALDALIMSLWLMPGLKTIHRLAFNVSVLVISIWVASQIFFAVSGIDFRAPQYTSLTTFVGPLYLFTACCFLLNSGMVAAALAFERGQSTLRIWREQFLWLSLNYFGGASVAALLVVYAKSIDWAVIGLIVPLMAISYLTFRTTLGRLEDANEHLSELNKLHLSTIETLAMAVDAKDQVTHGHIRRVQKYALGLSRCLGITDEKVLKAIEAAALLHDMGKLAIPDYILNKPGKLTSAEFDKMKMHAPLGADILSAIQFPYPVIPIVRHHHENWDGTGYPDKLKGTEIPLGARILSVVDCYDALRSDRPYRPSLSADEATSIIMQRRGVMYDPLVVDMFVSRLKSLEIEAEDIAPISKTLLQIAELNSTQTDMTMQPAIPNTGGSTTCIERQILSTLHPADVAPMALGAASSARGIIGALFFVGADNTTVLVAASVAGDHTEHVHGSHVEIGDRVIGWAASTGTPVANASAELEFGHESPFRNNKCSAFPVRCTDGTPTVLAFITNGTDIDSSTVAFLDRLTKSLVSQVSLVGVKATQASTPNALSSILRMLHVDDATAAACLPIGILAVRQLGDRKLSSLVIHHLVRSGDKITELPDGTIIFVIQQASDAVVRAVSSRISSEFKKSGSDNIAIEWGVLSELSDDANRQVSQMIRMRSRGDSERI